MAPPGTALTMPGKYGASWIVALTERRRKMKTYEFSVIASGLNPEAEDFEARFYDGGCDDAIVAFQKGHIIIDFAREAESIDAAISSAIETVRAVGAKVERIEPDPLVSLADIAARTDMSRAAMSLYAKEQRAEGFPAPIAKVTSNSSLYDWATVAFWLCRHKKVTRETAIEAAVVKEANEAICAGYLHLRDRLKKRARALEAEL